MPSPMPPPRRRPWLRAVYRRPPNPGRERSSAVASRHSVLCFVLTCVPCTIGFVGGPLGPTPVGCVCALNSDMNASPSTRLSAELSLPTLIAVLLITTPWDDRVTVLPP